MRTLILILVVLVLSLMPRSTKANNYDPPDGSTIPANQWELHADAGVAVDMIFYTGTREDDNTRHFYRIMLYIKNMASTGRYYGSTDEFRYFYMDANGVQHDMHVHAANPSGVTTYRDAMPIEIPPGKIQPTWIGLDQNDLLFVTTHPIQCTFVLIDSATQHEYQITTSPKRFYLQQ